MRSVSIGHLTKLIAILSVVRASPTAAEGSTNNPYEKGCLYHHNLTQDVRICGSEDPPEFADRGICRPSPLGYPEIRMMPANWESSVYETWILQILLSELLQVPTSIETGSPSTFLNFYNPHNGLDFPPIDYERQLEMAYNLSGDCGLADKSEANYEACGHFFTEIWSREARIQEMVFEGIIQPVQALGILGEEQWFVPKFTAQKDPSLLSHFGLQGPENQAKLAERFKKPITWERYCEDVSRDNCATPDLVAERPPADQSEANKFFQQGLYTGHFLATRQNDCTLTPNCKGYMHDYPCSWRSPVPPQIHWLNISLDPQIDEVGYTDLNAADRADIWRAANATKSDVIFYHFSPDKLFLEFQGTEAEFTPVLMPTPTQQCIENRVDRQDHCHPDLSIRHGIPESACQEPPNQVRSLLSSTVFHQAYAEDDSAVHSPAHAALSSFHITTLQIVDIFRIWSASESKNEREAVCQWVSENLDYMTNMIPRSYPRRVVQEEENTPIMYSTTTIGSFVALSVIIVAILVRENQQLKAIKHAQITFLYMLLIGSLLIALGAVTIGAPSTSASCILEIWLINLGYTAELAPLIVKTAGINHVLGSGKRMKRIKISRHFLLAIVALIGILVSTFLVIWTVLDPPQPKPQYRMVADEDNEETLVWVLDVCKSESMMWSYGAVGWNAGLLFVTMVYALKMRKVEMIGFNETSTLALMVYSHSVFVILRVVTYLLSSYISDYILAHCRSIIFSIDTMATLFIYFLPKFLAPEPEYSSRIFSGISSRGDSWYSNPGASSLSLLSTQSNNSAMSAKDHVANILKQQKEGTLNGSSDNMSNPTAAEKKETLGTVIEETAHSQSRNEEEDKPSDSEISELAEVASEDASASEVLPEDQEKPPDASSLRRSTLTSPAKSFLGLSGKTFLGMSGKNFHDSAGTTGISWRLNSSVGTRPSRLHSLHKTLSAITWVVAEEASAGDLSDSDDEGSIALSGLGGTRSGAGRDAAKDTRDEATISLLRYENEQLKQQVAALEEEKNAMQQDSEWQEDQANPVRPTATSKLTTIKVTKIRELDEV